MACNEVCRRRCATTSGSNRAPSLSVDLSPVDARDVAGIERALTNFARQPNGGVIVTLGGASIKHRDLIITLANQRLPAIYSDRFFVTGGGLISYGPDGIDQWRRADSQGRESSQPAGAGASTNW
jgi:putative ABC transport system substrate-binding protein